MSRAITVSLCIAVCHSDCFIRRYRSLVDAFRKGGGTRGFGTKRAPRRDPRARHDATKRTPPRDADTPPPWTGSWRVPPGPSPNPLIRVAPRVTYPAAAPRRQATCGLWVGGGGRAVHLPFCDPRHNDVFLIALNSISKPYELIYDF